MANLKDLIVSGKIRAISGIIGDLTGTASKATADRDGNQIDTNYVKTTRKVNNKALSSDILLTASDVGAAASSHTHTKSQITDFPTIPTVGDGVITITQGGVPKGSFTVNQTSAATIALDAGTLVTVDSALSTTSENPVQNKVITNNISGLETLSNKVTTVSASSTDIEYPSAKCVYSTVNRSVNSVYSYAITNINTILDVLDSKANKDGSNLIASIPNIDGQWVQSESTVFSTTTIGDYDINLSSYLPNDNNIYEVWIYGYVDRSGDSSGTNSQIYLSEYSADVNETQAFSTVFKLEADGGHFAQNSGSGLFTVYPHRKLHISITAYKPTSLLIKAVKYRRIGTNS